MPPAQADINGYLGAQDNLWINRELVPWNQIKDSGCGEDTSVTENPELWNGQGTLPQVQPTTSGGGTCPQV